MASTAERISKQRDIIDRSALAEKIEGVVFLSGDRHYSELTKTEFEGLYPIYELTSSGITSFRYKASKKPESVSTNAAAIPIGGIGNGSVARVRIAIQRSGRVPPNRRSHRRGPRASASSPRPSKP